MKLDKKAMPWLWGMSILLVALVNFAMFTTDWLVKGPGPGPAQSFIIIIAGFFALVLPVIFIPFDLLVHVPRAVHDDTTSSILPEIMLTPVTTRSILRDLSTWAFRLNMRHIMPSLLVYTSIIIYLIFGTLISGHNEITFILISIVFLFAIPVAALWHFLLITGLASAAFPRWVWSTGSSLLLWVVPVLSGVIWFGWYLYDGEAAWWIVVLTAALLLEIPTLLLARYLPRLISRRRAGEW